MGFGFTLTSPRNLTHKTFGPRRIKLGAQYIAAHKPERINRFAAWL
jgi:hypothetical protein